MQTTPRQNYLFRTEQFVCSKFCLAQVDGWKTFAKLHQPATNFNLQCLFTEHIGCVGTNQINLKLLLFTGRTFAFYLVIPSPSPALWSVINLLLTLESTRLSAIRFQSRLGAVRSLFLPQSQLIAEKEHEYDLEQFLFLILQNGL